MLEQIVETARDLVRVLGARGETLVAESAEEQGSQAFVFRGIGRYVRSLTDAAGRSCSL